MEDRMPEAEVRERTALVRCGPDSLACEGGTPEEAPVDGRGVLLVDELLEDGADRRPPPVRQELLIEFVRALIQNTWNGDVLHLSLLQAQRRTAATPEEVAALVAAVRQTHQSARLPRGFAPKF